MALLEARNLELHYQTDRGVLRAVDDLSFVLEKPGETLGIIGETGSGKTSLVYALSRVLPRNVSHYAGQLIVDGKDITGFSDQQFRRQIRWKQIAIVFQAAMNGFNPVIRIGKQIAERALAEPGAVASEVRETVERLLDSVGLARSAYDRFPHELSGGMKQRAAIAMALILHPPILILDEPTSALDVSVQAQIMNTLKQLKWDLGSSMIFITHDIALASDLCDRLVVMYAGQIREEGSAEQVLVDPQDPYTQELLESIPRLHGGARPGFVIGPPPDPISPPSGCRFHPRCRRALDRCRTVAPPLIDLAGGRAVRCWLHDDRIADTGPVGDTL